MINLTMLVLKPSPNVQSYYTPLGPIYLSLSKYVCKTNSTHFHFNRSAFKHKLSTFNFYMSTFCLCLYFYFTFKVSTIDLTFCDCSLFAEYFYSIDQLLMKKYVAYSDDSFLFQLSGFNLLKS